MLVSIRLVDHYMISSESNEMDTYAKVFAANKQNRNHDCGPQSEPELMLELAVEIDVALLVFDQVKIKNRSWLRQTIVNYWVQDWALRCMLNRLLLTLTSSTCYPRMFS